MGVYSTESLGGLHTMQGTLSEVGRLKSEQMISALGEEQPESGPKSPLRPRFRIVFGPFRIIFGPPTAAKASSRAEEWPSGGFLDLLLLVVLEPHLKELRLAADVAFTQPYGAAEAEVQAVPPGHFIRRGFLKRWRFLDQVEQELKTGIALATLLRATGQLHKKGHII